MIIIANIVVERTAGYCLSFVSSKYLHTRIRVQFDFYLSNSQDCTKLKFISVLSLPRLASPTSKPQSKVSCQLSRLCPRWLCTRGMSMRKRNNWKYATSLIWIRPTLLMTTLFLWISNSKRHRAIRLSLIYFFFTVMVIDCFMNNIFSPSASLSKYMNLYPLSYSIMIVKVTRSTDFF